MKNLRDLQETELAILDNLIKVFEKLNVEYYLIGGTALGAVRHNGFIPWDDDIDIGLPRCDYEYFLENASKFLQPNLFIQNCLTENKFHLFFTKIRNSNTTLVENETKFMNINHGVSIDIFPLDGCPKNNYITNFYLFCYKVLTALNRAHCNIQISYKYKYLNPIFKKFSHVFTSKKLYITANNLLRNYDFYKSDYFINLFGAWGKKEKFHKSCFGNGIYYKFENMSLKIPEKYHDYLTQMYGDYMIPPTENKRKSAHDIVLVDINKPYKQASQESIHIAN